MEREEYTESMGRRDEDAGHGYACAGWSSTHVLWLLSHICA